VTHAQELLNAMRGLCGAVGCLSDAIVNRLASHAAASCSAASSSLRESLQCRVVDHLSGARHFASGTDYTQSPPGLAQLPVLAFAAETYGQSRQDAWRCASSQEAASKHLLTTGAIAGDTKVKSEDQPGDSLEAELTRVRARRLTRAERPQYLGNAEFEEEVCLMPCYCLSLLVLDTKHITELSS